MFRKKNDQETVEHLKKTKEIFKDELNYAKKQERKQRYEKEKLLRLVLKFVSDLKEAGYIKENDTTLEEINIARDEIAVSLAKLRIEERTKGGDKLKEIRLRKKVF